MILFAAAATPAQTIVEGVTTPIEVAPATRPWPCQLTVTGDLRAFAELAWEHSPTFRDQCRKLAAGGATTIVEPASTREMWRAQTRIRRLDDGVTLARARVRPS